MLAASLKAASPTPRQQQAIAARGNVLVVAGAGAGKTQTVVDRCLAWLLDPAQDAAIDRVLMVTFTNAAAAEMRQRLRENLERAAASSPRAAESIALLDTAHICTLHSFCFHLVSRHFTELGLDPRARILPEERLRLLERETLDRVLEKVYDSESEPARAIQRLIQSQGGDWDLPVRELLLRLHHYTQTLRDPAAWFARQNTLFDQPEPTAWLDWLNDELSAFRARWQPVLEAQPSDNKNAAQCLKALAALPADAQRAQFAAALESILQADATWPKPKARWRDPIKHIFDEADFLHAICAAGQTDPLAEDWSWARPAMKALLDLAGQFDRAFQEARRRDGGIDYHDLEQFALRLLWQDGQPTAIARRWREKLELIFVDEYQDINEAQAAIIQALGRDDAGANRFLVGDVKQSIYGFRLADPRIFIRCQSEWSAAANATVIALTENFRSHESILRFINSIFDSLMRPETGGVNYDESARLKFGNADGRVHLAADAKLPPVELHLRCRGRDSAEAEEGDSGESLSDAEMEARIVGRRLLELKNQRATVFERDGQQRAAQWSDMVILLRSPRHKIEAYAKEFHRLGIPLAAARGGFYESLEVADLLNLLKILDNPLQDLPLLGVLRSPLVGATPDELALMRAGREHGRYWTAMAEWHRTTAAHDAHHEKISAFLGRFEAWRKLSRQSAVSHCLETIIDQTHYADWIATQERGAQRRANIERLLQLTRQFDASDGESLYRFLKFVEAQEEGEIDVEPAAPPASDAVRLMSIHQSKGSEFPIVVLADLGKPFNTTGTNSRIILDEEFGLCPQIQPPGSSQFYASLPHWLAQRRQKQKLIGEEMRLLYVALTRAAQRLILCGTAGSNGVENKWPAVASAPPASSEILSARSFLDWLGPWLLRVAGPSALDASGNCELASWTVYGENDPRLVRAEPVAALEKAPDDLHFSEEQRAALLWQYPFVAEASLPAKTTVTTLRRQIGDGDGEESFPIFSQAKSRGRLTGAEVGLAHHAFLQWVAFDKVQSVEGLKAEAARLARENILTDEQAAALDFAGLAAFWQSDPGRQLLSQPAHLHRELPFTARFSAGELLQLGAGRFVDVGRAEFIVVQGVADIVALLPGEIWLLDFKTDRFPAAAIEEKIKTYGPQLALYALALERTHHRAVTKRWLHFLALRHTASL
jgi:ATP-dependent helicase/nuclease subunit A